MSRTLTKKFWNEFLEYAESEGIYDPYEQKQAVYNDLEKRIINKEQKVLNDLGYDIQITSLTQISKKVSDQKFYTTAPADFVPIVVGEGAYADQITTYRTFDDAGSFEDGIVNTGDDNTRLASADASVDSVSTLTYQWAKSTSWSLIQLMQAARSGNWNIVVSKQKARKKNWDLGIQKIAFLGADGSNGVNGSCVGLLNQSNVTVNSTLITKPISTMTTAELKAFQAAAINTYRVNNNRTAFPTAFVVPESDFLGMASQSSEDFPIKSVLELLLEAFKVTTQNPNFKILPLAYADAGYHSSVSSIAGKQCYVFLNYDEESMKMDVPVPYTVTVPNSLNNFQMQDVGYGQFTGLQVLRPLELLYCQY